MKSKYLITLLISLLVAGSTAALLRTPLAERFESGVLSSWFVLRGTTPPPEDVVIVAMDEQSYRDLDVPLSQAWPRKLHARLLERLAEMGARRVVFDVLFLDAGSDPKADVALARAIAYLPVHLGSESAIQNIAGASGSFSIEELLEPYEPFTKAAAGLGLVSLPEQNGVVRSFLTSRSERTADLPTLAEAGAGLTMTDSAPRPRSRDLINFYGPARTLKTFSFYEIVQTERPLSAEFIRGKIVYVGLALRTDTGPAQKDIFQTSYGGARIFGLEVHATAAANLMRGDWIRRFPYSLEFVGQVFVAAALSFAMISLSPTWGGALLCVVWLLWMFSSYLFFRNLYYVPGAFVVTVVAPIVYLGSTLYYYFVVRRAARQMRSAFELYLSPEMAQQLTQGNSAAALGGSKLWATALFTDIEGFTNITEEMPAERVADMLNCYFTEVMEVIFKNKGTLIKFIGDAVFVLWGAPVRIDNHAELAIRTAIVLNQEVDRFNLTGKFPPLRTRIGINTGPMVVGNLGSKRRFDYTAIGDSVNLASRIEGLNKYLGTSLLFSEATRKDAGSLVSAVKVADVRVVGKKETVSLYTTFEPPPTSAVTLLMQSALESFGRRNWAEASAAFNDIKARESRLAGVCAIYQESITRFTTNSPSDGWAGELEFTQK